MAHCKVEPGMHQRKDLAGKRFGYLSVISYSHTKGGKAFWTCRCDCGITKPVNGGDMRQGKIVSCGCMRDINTGDRSRTHGLTRTRTYRIWANIIQRCDPVYGHKDYGLRGILVCDRWKKFDNFIADMGECPGNLQIDRINNNGNYEPGNCRWTTCKENTRNTRKNVRLTHEGQTKTMSEWSEVTGVPYWALVSRIQKLSWPVAKALTQPIRRKAK